MLQTETSERILVNGGAGFIGSHSVDLLREQGYKVTVLDNLPSGKKTNLGITDARKEDIQDSLANITKAVEILDFKAKGNLADNINNMLNE